MLIDYDIVICGAGVVGLAIAKKLSESGKACLLIEKNSHIGSETSSRNSEVIHAGLYYKNSPLKEKFCILGRQLLYDYCSKNSIPFSNCGKYIVGHTDDKSYISDVYKRCHKNNLKDIEILNKNQINDIYPSLNAEIALYSPYTGIIDSHAYMNSLHSQFKGDSVYKCSVEEVKNKKNYLEVITNQGCIRTFNFINSAGLWSYDIAKKMDFDCLIPNHKFVKGNYFSYSGKNPFNHLIYPIPNKDGLGIHLTTDLNSQAKFGPDTEILDIKTYPSEIDYNVNENLKEKFYKCIKDYWPSVNKDKLHAGYSGIRSKAYIDSRAHNDFVIDEINHGYGKAVNLFGIESPGLTSSLAIANYINTLIHNQL